MTVTVTSLGFALVQLDGSILNVALSQIPYRPKTGIALGLFTLCQLVAWGLVGAISPILRPETAISSAVVGGAALFGLLYGVGWLLVS
jgi:hypothetical protein